MSGRRAVGTGVAVLIGAGLGLWGMGLSPSQVVEMAATPSGTARGYTRPAKVEAPRLREGTDRQPAPDDREAPVVNGPVGDPQLEAFLRHARESIPAYRKAARILSHANPPVYGVIADDLANRLEQVTHQTGLGERQELLVEQKQLVDHLRRRYEGLEELEPLLDRLEESVETVERTVVEVGPSPDPQARSAQGAERTNPN